MDRAAEPPVPPDWSKAPRRLAPETVASAFDRSLGAAVHVALARWQRAVDGGARRSAAGLLATARREATTAGLAGAEIERAFGRLEKGLAAYAEGPWPRRATIFLEQPVRHTLAAADGFGLELHLRVDRVARYRRSIAICDFKTVTPHALEMREDAWQLRTYALAAPELLGVAPWSVHLFVIDLPAATEHEVTADRPSLEAATTELLASGRAIAAGDFGLGSAHRDRPCWSCGFRLTCPSSLAPSPPHRN